jgi:hypothetical protein
MSRKKKLIIILPLLIILLVGLNTMLEETITIKQELSIDKNVEAVWDVMGNQFGEVHLWSSNFIESKPGGDKIFEGIGYSNRITLTERGETIQALDAFDTTNYSLSYHITKGAPAIAKKASAVWSLKSISKNETIVILEFELITKGVIGYVMASKINNKIEAAAKGLAEELKFYVETNTPHQRNIKK